MSDSPSALPPLPQPAPDAEPVPERGLAASRAARAPCTTPGWCPAAGRWWWRCWPLPGCWAAALLWQKLGAIQEELARRTTDSSAQSIEARTLAREAQDSARELSARLALQETRLSEVSLQRTQLEELMQSLSRSRDENLVVDVESALRLAQQQALADRQRRALAGRAQVGRPCG